MLIKKVEVTLSLIQEYIKKYKRLKACEIGLEKNVCRLQTYIGSLKKDIKDKLVLIERLLVIANSYIFTYKEGQYLSLSALTKDLIIDLITRLLKTRPFPETRILRKGIANFSTTEMESLYLYCNYSEVYSGLIEKSREIVGEIKKTEVLGASFKTVRNKQLTLNISSTRDEITKNPIGKPHKRELSSYVFWI